MTPHVDEPLISLRGVKVALAPLDRSAISRQTVWMNDFVTTRTLNADPVPRTIASHERWYEQVTTQETALTLAVYDLSDLAHVGNVGLFDIDQRHSSCELGVGILEPGRRGRGLGTEAVTLVTDYAVRYLGMHNVKLSVLEFNIAGIRAYHKAGFREYGRRREARLHNGRRWDMVYMDILASEWESSSPPSA